jgi:hypothetical protein
MTVFMAAPLWAFIMFQGGSARAAAVLLALAKGSEAASTTMPGQSFQQFRSGLNSTGENWDTEYDSTWAKIAATLVMFAAAAGLVCCPARNKTKPKEVLTAEKEIQTCSICGPWPAPAFTRQGSAAEYFVTPYGVKFHTSTNCCYVDPTTAKRYTLCSVCGKR